MNLESKKKLLGELIEMSRKKTFELGFSVTSGLINCEPDALEVPFLISDVSANPEIDVKFAEMCFKNFTQICKDLQVAIQTLETLKHLNHHKVEEEVWRIDEALQKIGGEG